jgi:hypothetical protein
MYLDPDDFLLEIGNDAFAVLMILLEYHQFIDVIKSSFYLGVQGEKEELVYDCNVHHLLALCHY